MEDSSPSTPEWMVTFSDIISLLVTFFLLLITYSSVNSQKFSLAAGSLQGTLGFLGGERKDALETLESEVTPLMPSPERDYANLPGPDFSTEEKLPQSLTKQHKAIPIDKTQGNKSLLLKTHIYFGDNSSELPKYAIPILREIANSLRYYHNHISIKGFANAQKGTLSAYNLAAKRAFKVWNFLVKHEKISPQRLHLTACTFNKNLTDFSQVLERKKLRTVEIIIWDKKFSFKEE